MSLIKGSSPLHIQSICLPRAELAVLGRNKMCLKDEGRTDEERRSTWWQMMRRASTLGARCSRGKSPGGKHCLHNLYKYLSLLYPSHCGVVMYSRVKRWTPTHLWNARSAFLCRTSCIPRNEAEKGSIRQWQVSDRYKAHHKNYTFWVCVCSVLPQAQRETGPCTRGCDLAWCRGDSVSWGSFLVPQA